MLYDCKKCKVYHGLIKDFDAALCHKGSGKDSYFCEHFKSTEAPKSIFVKIKSLFKT